MGFRLEADEPLAWGLRRALIEALDSAASELGDIDADRFDDAIHEARRSLKKARTVLRLLRDVLGDARYRTANERLRDAGAILSGTRDAAVLLETIDGLLDSAEVDGATLADLRQRLAGERAEARRLALVASGPRDQALERIVAGRSDTARWRVDSDLDERVWRGVQRAYDRGRERMNVARREPTPEALHEWRKRVKDLGYTLELFRPSWPEVIEAWFAEVRRLWGLLGDDHDLHVLAVEARARADALPTPRALEALGDLIMARRWALQQRAFGLGQRLYADSPKAFACRLGACLRAWQAREEAPC